MVVLLEYADVVYVHRLWKNGRSVGRPGPVSAHCDVGDKEKRSIVTVGRGTYVAHTHGVKELVVDIKTNVVLNPDNAEHVVCVRKVALLQRVGSGAVGADSAALNAPVRGSVHFMGLVTHEFHNVGFAACGPTNLADVCSKHP